VTESIAHQVLDRAITEACFNERFETYTIVIPQHELAEYLKAGAVLPEEALVITISVTTESNMSANDEGDLQ